MKQYNIDTDARQTELHLVPRKVYVTDQFKVVLTVRFNLFQIIRNYSL